MLESIFGNPHYKLASLLIAVLAWLYVQSDQLHDEPLNAHIQWSSAARGLISVEPLPTAVTLRARGTRSALRRALEGRLDIEVDIGDLTPGEHYIELGSYAVAGITGNIEILGHTPAGIAFELDVEESRKVKVRPVVVGEPADGYAVDSIVLTPAAVTIRGPAVRIASLGEIETEPIDVSSLTGDAVVPVGLNLPKGLENAEGMDLSVEITILALKEERTFPAVPVYVWGSGPYRVSEQTVEVVVQGPTATLERLEAADIVAFAHGPDGGDAAKYQVAWGPLDGPRLRILHAAGDAVRVVAVEPSRLEIRRR